MSLTKLTTDLENIQALSDKPNEIEGLTADELKAKFDKGNGDIKTFINDTLTTELDTALGLKVNKTDIVDNLTTNDATKILSAAQGKILQDGKLATTSISATTSLITLPDGTKIIFGTTAAYTFVGVGTKTETISLATYNLSAIYSATVSAQLTYVDSQYMLDTACYVHSKSTTELKVNIVNTYPSSIGYYVNYIVIGK